MAVSDPKLEGYLPLDHFRVTDADRPSRLIRDDPQYNMFLNGALYDYNRDSEEIAINPNIVDWN